MDCDCNKPTPPISIKCTFKMPLKAGSVVRLSDVAIAPQDLWQAKADALGDALVAKLAEIAERWER